MGSHHSTSAPNKAPRAIKFPDGSSVTSGADGAGARLFRLSNDDSSSSQANYCHSMSNAGQCHHKRISIPTLISGGKTSNAKMEHHVEGRKKRGGSGRKAEKIISSLDKKVHQLVRERASGLIGGDKMQLKNCSAKMANNNSNSNNNYENNSNYNYHFAQSFNHGKHAKQRQRGVSISDSDVFIYPSNYRDMNECQKCARDNKICNCNVIEAASITPLGSSDSASSSSHDNSDFELTVSANDSTTAGNINDNDEADNDEQRRPSGELNIAVRRLASAEMVSSNRQQHSNRTARAQQSDCEASGRAVRPDRDDQDIGGHAPASRNQRSDQARLSEPQIAHTIRPRADTVNVCASCHQRLRTCRSNDLRSMVMSQSQYQTNSNVATNETLKSELERGRDDRIVFLAQERLENNHHESSASKSAAQPISLVATSVGQQHGDEPSGIRSRAKSMPDSANTFSQTTNSTITTTTTTSFQSCHIIAPYAPNSSNPTPTVDKIICSGSSSQLHARSVTISKGEQQDSIDSYSNSVSKCDSGKGDGRNTDDDKIIIRGKDLTQLSHNLGTIRSDSRLPREVSSTHSFSRLSECLQSTDAGHGSEKATKSSALQCSVSQRRKNLSSRLSNRRTALDDNNNSTREKNFNIVDCIQLDASTLEDSTANEGSDISIQGYSPILSSVRDYIENVNPELRLHHATQSILPSTNLFDNLITSCEQQQRLQHEPQQPQTTIAVVDINGSVPAIELQPRPSDIIVQTSMTAAAAVVSSRTICASTAIVAAPSGMVGLDRGVDGTTGAGTPKKSIFDGASKDEILEYLEDARERVPEVLIAADDVMVISENELIVVNQLDPSSPATPISIVEANDEVGATETATSFVTQTTSTSFSNQMSEQSQSPDSEETYLIQSHDALTFDNDRIEEASEIPSPSPDEKLASIEQRNSMNSRYDTPGDRDVYGQALNDQLKNRLRYQVEDENDGERAPAPRRTALLASSSSRSNTSCGEISLDASSPCSQDNQLIDPPIEYNQQSTTTLINEMLAQPAVANNSLYDQHHKLHIRERRKSTSESCSKFLREENRYNTLQMMLLHQQAQHQQRHQAKQQHSQCCNHAESIYSSSSSPPSSNSTSTCASQTSGNCTAASTFYASPSLSCSSPFLASSGQQQNKLSTVAAAVGSDSPISSRSTSTPTSDHPQQRQHRADGLSAGEVTTAENQQQVRHNRQVKRNDSGLGADSQSPHDQQTSLNNSQVVCTRAIVASDDQFRTSIKLARATSRREHKKEESKAESKVAVANDTNNNRLNVIEEATQQSKMATFRTCHEYNQKQADSGAVTTITTASHRASNELAPPSAAASGFVTRPLHSHYATMNRFNSYLTKRRANGSMNKDLSDDSMIEFQCLDCDQLICVDHARMLDATNEIKMLRENDITQESIKDKPMTSDQLERAYVVAMNGLPLCKSCEKKRTERKEIVSEFVETELKYGRDLKIIHDEFYRPMQIAGLLNKDQINGVFLNLDELIMAHCRFADRLGAAISEALAIGDADYNTVNIGKLFVESADMLHTFESYCIRQGSAACLLARLAKEKELLRIFLRVSQMENTLLRRMNLAAFLMVPVQRVTKYPLLLNRLYKVTPYHHKDREALRDAQLKVELHLEHINQQTKGVSATNKIWRRISNLSAASNSNSSSNNRRGMINAEDIGYIKLRKVAMDILKWDRDETQFIHSGKINFTPLNEYLTKQRAKPMRYMAAHALLIVLGKPNWKYRPDLVKSNLDYKLMVPTAGGTGIKEAALLLFREKNGRFIPCRDPLFLSNCVLSTDCSQYNNDQSLPGTINHQHKLEQQKHQSNANKQLISASSLNHHDQLLNSSGERKSLPGLGSALNSSSSTGSNKKDAKCSFDSKTATNKSGILATGRNGCNSIRAVEYFKMNKTLSTHSKGSDASAEVLFSADNQQPQAVQVDSVSMSSLKSLPEEQLLNSNGNEATSVSPPLQTPRSYSLASALPRTPITTMSSNSNLTKSTAHTTSSNLTILNHLMSKVNNYHHGNNKQHANVTGSKSSNDSSSVTTMAKTMSFSHCDDQLLSASNKNGLISTQSIDNLIRVSNGGDSAAKQSVTDSVGKSTALTPGSKVAATTITNSSTSLLANANVELSSSHHHYNHHFFHNHHQPYGDYEESFELHERISKESLLFRADTPLKTRYWLQMLRYHAKDLGPWRTRRNGLANIMMMRQD